jgi:CHAT domain-containing protein
MQQVPTIPDIVNCFTYGSVEAQIALLAQWPSNIYRPVAEQFIRLEQPASAVAALDALCLGYHDKVHAQLLLSVAQAAQQLAIPLVAMPDPVGSDGNEYMGKAMCWHIRALLHLRQPDAAIATGDAAQAWLQGMQAPPMAIFHRIELQVIEALLQKGTLETARTRFQAVENKITAPEDLIQLNSIRDNLNRLLQSASTVAADYAAPNNASIRQHLLEQVEALVQQHAQNPDTLPVAENVKAALEREQNAIEQGASEHHAHRSASKEIYEQFTQLYGHNIVHELQQRSQAAWMVFHEPTRAHDPDHLRVALNELLDICQTVEQQRVNYDLKTVWWSIGVIYNRLGQPREGLFWVEQLWATLETERLQIKDYHQRAGVFYQFEFLFVRLCDFYEKTGNTKGLLHAIESSKGRVLADALERQNNAAAAADQFPQLLQQLPYLLAREQANYLSFLFDDDEGYAVLMNPQGQLFSQRLSIGKNQLQAWLQSQLHNPQQWQARTTGLFGARNTVDITTALSPLVDWLLPLVEAGHLKKGSHICYCPDDDLLLFPLHYIRLGQQFLIEQFTLSRTQGVANLVQTLEQPLHRPTHFVGVTATALEDASNPELRDAFAVVNHFLSEKLSSDVVLKQEQATIEALEQQSLTGQLIHFSTHGTFPVQTEANPYGSSGLLLSDGQQLPSLNQPTAAMLLSPEQLMRGKWRFEGAHIGLQACVSGRAKEGIGGDALGLEWAFLLKGAGSVLSTNWNVDAAASAQFCCHFYQKWLLQGYTRAAALQQCCLEGMENATPYYWAAFTLSGDWR